MRFSQPLFNIGIKSSFSTKIGTSTEIKFNLIIMHGSRRTLVSSWGRERVVIYVYVGNTFAFTLQCSDSEQFNT